VPDAALLFAGAESEQSKIKNPKFKAIIGLVTRELAYRQRNPASHCCEFNDRFRIWMPARRCDRDFRPFRLSRVAWIDARRRMKILPAIIFLISDH
jgi:hypothetical protein